MIHTFLVRGRAITEFVAEIDAANPEDAQEIAEKCANSMNIEQLKQYNEIDYVMRA